MDIWSLSSNQSALQRYPLFYYILNLHHLSAGLPFEGTSFRTKNMYIQPCKSLNKKYTLKRDVSRLRNFID